MTDTFESQENIEFIKNFIIREIEEKQVYVNENIDRATMMFEMYDNSMKEIDETRDSSQFKMMNNERSMYLKLCEIADAFDKSYGVNLNVDAMQLDELRNAIVSIYNMLVCNFVNSSAYTLSKIIEKEYDDNLTLKHIAYGSMLKEIPLFKYIDGCDEKVCIIAIASMVNTLLMNEHSVAISLSEVVLPDYLSTVDNVNITFNKSLLEIIYELGDNAGLYHSINMLTSKIAENLKTSKVHEDLYGYIERQK